MAIKIEKGKIPIWEKYMLTVDEAVQYFGIGEKKIRMLISEHLNSECCFTVQVLKPEEISMNGITGAENARNGIS